MTTTRTWTRHTFRCTRCQRRAYASAETIAEFRRDMDFAGASDAEVAAAIDFCLACVDGTPLAGEHVPDGAGEGAGLDSAPPAQ
jgi:hypothetical protein